MSIFENSSRFCLFCYKNTEFSNETNGDSDKIKIFTKVLNRLTKQDKGAYLFKHELLDKLTDIIKLLVCCAQCQGIITEICETFHTIKTLELQLDWKLDKLKNKISYANKVPSRWVNVNTNLDKLYQNDPSKKPTTQSTIREFGRNIVNAADYRQMRSQPRVSIKRKEYIDQATKYLTSDHFSGVKLRKDYRANSCPICGKQLKNRNRLIQHINYHKAKKEWKAECPYCKKRFSRMFNLKTHMKIHTGEKDYKCMLCGKDFGYMKSLKRHLKRKHGCEKRVEKKSKLFKDDSDEMDDNSYGDENGDQLSTVDIVEEEMPFHETDAESASMQYREDYTAFADPQIQIKIEH